MVYNAHVDSCCPYCVGRRKWGITPTELYSELEFKKAHKILVHHYCTVIDLEVLELETIAAKACHYPLSNTSQTSYRSLSCYSNTSLTSLITGHESLMLDDVLDA